MNRYYKIYNSNVIANNRNKAYMHCSYAYKKRKELYSSNLDYNLFELSSSSDIFYDLCKEITYVIKDYLEHSPKVWMTSSINYYQQDENIEPVFHSYDFCGYICLEPRGTITKFDDWEIENKPGLIYIGPGNTTSETIITSPYDGYRGFIEFGCSVRQDQDFKEKFYPVIT